MAVCWSRGCWDWPISISNSLSSAPWLSGSKPRRRCHWTSLSRIFSVTTSSSMGPIGGTLVPLSELSAGRSSASKHNIWSVLFLTAVRSSLEDEVSCCSNTQDIWEKEVRSVLLLYPVGLSDEVFEVHANETRTNTRTVMAHVGICLCNTIHRTECYSTLQCFLKSINSASMLTGSSFSPRGRNSLKALPRYWVH